jgi:hypothetical protein
MITSPKVWPTDKVAFLLSFCNILKTTYFRIVLDIFKFMFTLNYLLFIHTRSTIWKVTFIIGKLIWFTYSKRTSGFDMAPPASAMLTGASAVAGTLSHMYITNSFNLNFFSFLLLLILVWKIQYRITRCLLGKISFSYYWVGI